MFSSLQAAVDYLQNKLQDFYNQRGVLAGRLKSIQQLKDAALKTNNQQALGQLIVMREGVVALLREQLDLEDKLKPYADYFGVSTWRPLELGALPLILAGGAVVVAGLMYLHLSKLQNQAKALDMIAKGILPADQADSILNPGLFSGGLGQISSILMVAVGGYALFLFGPMLSKMLGGRK